MWSSKKQKGVATSATEAEKCRSHREVMADHAVAIDYVPTGDQAADILTKPLTKQTFERGSTILE